ncbi:uncharacterized protein LOC121998598 isoform X1 [Zingiber officinale]|uniref:uncharacterized protein LOC121998598 isoform X1 n=1 Tax=Zingiber officinale TaxID=94328 RepID=UPI001C4CEC7E|nr:uncharacterized protein LOC121998598 isoform X1 [Zingiber officinale]XP_042409518.1 uncharacterized protein LOC121998598 isoform X1 [Zingiber officinale]
MKRKMSSREVRKVSRQDIQLVQNLIERCLQLHMKQKEVVDTLSLQAKIEPSFTELVWQKLEEENQEFFKAYHLRLILKNQIIVFNNLLEKQVELMRKACLPGDAALPFTNGSNSLASHQTPSCYLSQPTSTSSRPDSMPFNGDFSSALVNAGPLGQPENCLGNAPSILVGSMNASTSVFSSHKDRIGRIPGMNGMTLKPEPIYSIDEFPFGNDNGIFEPQPLADASVGSFSSSELTEQHIHNSLLDVDTSSLGFSQMPRNFSFLDLTDVFNNCADILENYSTSPYIPADSNNFSSSPSREFKEDSGGLDTKSEGVNFEDFF